MFSLQLNIGASLFRVSIKPSLLCMCEPVEHMVGLGFVFLISNV